MSQARYHLLLVEDDPDVRIVMTAQLKQLGYNVYAVANGMEAIDLIGSPANIDVTLTDIVLRAASMVWPS
jgi:CheY-like chemotaxis protein